MKIYSLLFLLLCLSTNVLAEEKILDFHSRISVLDNGDIHVTEKIKVNVENHNIRHGIFRSTPTVYYGVFFTHKNTDIIILKTRLDGEWVKHHQENLLNGIRVYLGSKNEYVSKGIHTYEIEYIAKGQVIDLAKSNGIYWNVTGTDWDFPIIRARADIYMPNASDINILTHEAWTGYSGSTNKDYQAAIYNDYIRFETNRRLNPGQGLTIQASWPQGLITQASGKTWIFISNNFLWILSVIMLFLYPLYFYQTWKKVGIDPPKGAVFPIFSPPNNISPAAMRFVEKKYYDTKGFSVAIMNTAVKKHISIEQLSKKKYILTKMSAENNRSLSNGEKTAYKYLFKNRKTITIDASYDSTIKTANNLLKISITDEHKDACYRNNIKAWVLGVLMSLLMVFINWGHFFNFSSYAIPFLIMPVAAIIISALAVGLLKKTFQKALAVIIPLLVLIFALKAQIENIYSAYIVLVILMVFINALFYYLIQAPTVFGRKLLDKIAGFKMYLSTAEQNRLELMHPPEMTPELFEKYLPYALALSVENSWSEQFNKAMIAQGKDTKSYRPGWYVGSNYSSFDFASTATAIGAGLASSVVSAATPPSSNSSGGFSGGGFSGGGGGGGGGGGW
ncbi:MAG: DUF2207 domain-containing protein [Alcanivoracaceae bacterium]|nr:DUF2207 domain-containing protein [Alcanivoracaceae bacterium]